MAIKIQSSVQYPGDDTIYKMYDSGAVRFDEEQHLTDEQKARAFQNIGAGITDEQKLCLIQLKNALKECLSLGIYEDDGTNPGRQKVDATIAAFENFLDTL